MTIIHHLVLRAIITLHNCHHFSAPILIASVFLRCLSYYFSCLKKIFSFLKILRATGKPYHAQCFSCVACQKSLDGVPFTVDATMQIHCIDCFHQKFAPRCHACHRPILPIVGQEETVRIVALDRSYHIDCYRCEVRNFFFSKL
jgi:hypothetical protein